MGKCLAFAHGAFGNAGKLQNPVHIIGENLRYIGPFLAENKRGCQGAGSHNASLYEAKSDNAQCATRKIAQDKASHGRAKAIAALSKNNHIGEMPYYHFPFPTVRLIIPLELLADLPIMFSDSSLITSYHRKGDTRRSTIRHEPFRLSQDVHGCNSADNIHTQEIMTYGKSW